MFIDDMANEFSRRRISRRQFLSGTSKFGLTLAIASPLLAACGGDEEPEETGSGAGAQTPAGGADSIPDATPEDDDDTTSEQDTAEGGDGQLVVGLVAEPIALDGAQVTDANSARVIRRITEQMVAFDDEMPELVPGLAESWDISDDGLEYTFHLREGITFHDGTPFNAEAVQYSLLRQVDETHPANPYATYPYSSLYFGTIGTIEAEDDQTVVIGLTSARASFLAAIATAAAGIVSPTAVEEHTENYSQHPTGTGPFRFVSWEPGVEVVLEANPDYWGDVPALGQVIFKPYIEEQVRLTALQTGGVNFIVDVPPDNLEVLEQDPNITVLRQTGIHFWYVGLNVTKGALTDVNVRKALAHAIDKEAITRDVLAGTGEPANSMLNPGTWGYSEDVPTYDFDPDRARELLAEAGYADGLEITMWVPESGSGMQSPVPMATVIQANWEDVGITANMQTYEWGTFLDNLRTGDQEVFCNSWMAGVPDPDMTLFSFLHTSQHAPNGPNRFFYSDDEVDRLLEEARATTDQDERARLYEQVQQIAYDAVPLIPIEHQIQTAAMASNVQGFELHPNFDLLRIKDTSIE